MSEYPKCKYSKDSPAVVVADAAEEKALGSGWFDHPSQVTAEVVDNSAADTDTKKPRAKKSVPVSEQKSPEEV